MIALLVTLLNCAFWSAVAWLVCPRVGVEPWAGYAFGLAIVLLFHNFGAHRQARRLPTFKDTH